MIFLNRNREENNNTLQAKTTAKRNTRVIKKI